jgi:hypothetical protein
MGTPSYAEFSTYSFGLTCLPAPHWGVIITLASSPHVCGRRLLVWVMSMTSSPLSVLAASTCMVAVWHHLLLTLVSCSALSHRRQSPHHLPFFLRGCLRPVWVVLLPLAAGPRRMPRRPQLATPITRGGLLSTELPWRLGNISLCLGGCCWCSGPPPFSGPLITGWASFHTRSGGRCPSSWPGGAGSDLLHCHCMWATAPGDILFIRGLLVSLVHPSSEGLLSAAGAIQGVLSSLFRGGDLQ